MEAVRSLSHFSGVVMVRVRRDYGKAWSGSVPAEQAPSDLAPKASFMRLLSDRYPTVAVRYDPRPSRRCFVLWEHTRAGDWVVISDIPSGVPLEKTFDYLALCDLAKQPSFQKILEDMDAREEARLNEERPPDKTDHERILWAARKAYGEEMSRPMAIQSVVPDNLT